MGTMPITPMNDIIPIEGDDLPIHTLAYRDVPEPFRFKNLKYDPDEHPEIDAKFGDLIDAADRFFANYEVVGITLQDFFDGLQSSFERNKDTLERVLKVYDDDIANPILGRTRKVTYDVTDEVSSSTNVSSNEEHEDKQTDINVPLDDPANEQASFRSTVKGGSGSSGNSGTTGSNKKTGTETEELSDLGVRPNYESLNGFIDNNRSYQTIFINFFKDNFMICESWKW